MPYIVSGDRFYLEEFWANWNLGVSLPARRQGSAGIILGTEQTRGEAWGLRAIAEAAEVTPDRDPMKRYFDAGADTSMKWLGVIAVGLWTNEQNGFCRMNAPTGWMQRRVNAGGALIASWSELQKINFPQQASCPTSFPSEAYDGSPIGYVVDAMSAAAVLSDYGYPEARQVFDALNERERNVPYARDPTWRIVPR